MKKQKQFASYLLAGIPMVIMLNPLNSAGETGSPDNRETPVMKIFLCGDVMTGRGIDQVLPHPSDPVIHESYMKNAKGYVEIAERYNGPIPAPVGFSYIWGDALEVWQSLNPDIRVINLETSITKSDDYWKYKGINYRMHPANVPCLTAAGIDFCSLANNHVLDWGYDGLRETLETLEDAGIQYAGAGTDMKEAEKPAVLEFEGEGRLIVLAYGSVTSGIPSSWAARDKRAGVNVLKDFSDNTVRCIKGMVEQLKKPGDIVLFTVHWGGNWGYEIPARQIEFAHKLIDQAGVDIVHGHSSHHVKGIEVYRGKPVLYGCGDFLNDYEGIRSHEGYRGDLALMYFVSMDPVMGKLIEIKMVPTQTRRFRVNRAGPSDTEWLLDMLNREGERFGTRVEIRDDLTFLLHWD